MTYGHGVQVLQLQLEHAGAPLYMEPKVTFLHKKALERKEKAAAEPTAEADNTAQVSCKLKCVLLALVSTLRGLS